MPEKIVTDEQEDLALKLTIEAALIASFGKLFRRIARDFRTVYAATGRILDAEVYEPEVVSILRPSYRRAASTAGKELRRNADVSFPADNRSEVEGDIDVSLLRFGEEESDERAGIIGETTDGKLRNFTLSAIVSAALAGFFPGNEQVAVEVAKRFVADSKSRSRMIGIQESLNAVEGSRLIETNGLIEGQAAVKVGNEEPKPLSLALFREWVARVDDWENVRRTHKAAHGQRVPGAGTPFVVGNSYLMYPGDTSLGASLDEIMGCRCYAATRIG